jgi:exopolyphosphatase/guanosine-5'-triphosphate,3'-diphosphate pyrophosphatase
VLRGSDLRAVREQLGREPTVPFTVVASCRTAHPLVIRNGTRDADGAPFPTTFWLTCPEATRAVARIESRGAIRGLNELIQTDAGFADAAAAAHAEAAAVREADEPGAGDWGGVGGTRTGIKCLHAHYANHLAGGDDPAGRWVAERVEPVHPDAPAGRVIAAIDQGTNSTRLLVLADGSPPVELARDLVITRLGQGVDATGRLDPDALRRVQLVLLRYARRARALGAERIHVGATSAVRDAANRDAFVALVTDTTGVEPEIVSGEREAELSFGGATRGRDASEGPFAVLDIGGGSTEFVTGAAPGRVDAALSAQIGSVRLTERHLSHDPPTEEDLEALDRAITEVLDGVWSLVPVRNARTFLAVAGTAVTVQALAMGLDRDDPDLIHGSPLSVSDAIRVRDRVAAMTIAERDALPAMPRGRGEVIVAGAAILAAVLTRGNHTHAIVSETDILDGLAFELLGVG